MSERLIPNLCAPCDLGNHRNEPHDNRYGPCECHCAAVQSSNQKDSSPSPSLSVREEAEQLACKLYDKWMNKHKKNANYPTSWDAREMLTLALLQRQSAPAVQTEKPDGVEPLLEALREDVIGIAAELKKCKDCKHRWSLTRLAYCEEQLDRQIAAYSQARGQKEG